jgi:hypothetical protein
MIFALVEVGGVWCFFRLVTGSPSMDMDMDIVDWIRILVNERRYP